MQDEFSKKYDSKIEGVLGYYDRVVILLPHMSLRYSYSAHCDLFACLSMPIQIIYPAINQLSRSFKNATALLYNEVRFSMPQPVVLKCLQIFGSLFLGDSTIYLFIGFSKNAYLYKYRYLLG